LFKNILEKKIKEAKKMYHKIGKKTQKSPKTGQKTPFFEKIAYFLYFFWFFL
jgi:hypothetical protein